jgi:hypothetical protein
MKLHHPVTLIDPNIVLITLFLNALNTFCSCEAIKMFCLKINTDNKKCMSMFRHQDAGKNYNMETLHKPSKVWRSSKTCLFTYFVVQDVLCKPDSYSACQITACFLYGVLRFITMFTKARH